MLHNFLRIKPRLILIPVVISHIYPGNICGVIWIKLHLIHKDNKFVLDNLDIRCVEMQSIKKHTEEKHLVKHKMINEYVPKYEDGTIISIICSIITIIELK